MLARQNMSVTTPMPTIEEVLSGQTQGGVPRPEILKEHDDDGSAERAYRPLDLHETGEF